MYRLKLYMASIMTALSLSCLLSSCSFFQIHKPIIEQGNIISAEKTRLLHKGMSESEVIALMGKPILENLFSPGRLEYVYTYQVGNNPRETKTVTCLFTQGRLSLIQFQP